MERFLGEERSLREPVCNRFWNVFWERNVAGGVANPAPPRRDIASTAGVRPQPGLTWYNGTKGAVITLTKSMAVELAPDNIRVNALNPVAGETPLLLQFLPGEDTPEIRQKFIDTIPLGRLSLPADIAYAALFLVSDEAQFITGVCMEIDGGRCV